MQWRLLASVPLLYLLACGLSSAWAEEIPSSVAGQSPHVVFLSFEEEYSASETLPKFAKVLEDRFGWRTTLLVGDVKDGFRGLEALEKADAVVMYIRRHALPQRQMDQLHRYLDAGKPLVALRTSCHAFEVKGPAPQGLVQWPEFGRDVLGANYTGHCGHDNPTEVSLVESSKSHPILTGVAPRQWGSTSWLYNVSPIDAKATVLLEGKWKETTESTAWTRSYGKSRVFFTSLGDAKDFRMPQFQRLLINGLCWTMDIVQPEGAEAAVKEAAQ